MSPSRLTAVVFAVVCVAALATGCEPVSDFNNAMVVHIVTEDCEPDPALEPLLVVERVSGGQGKATTTEWHPMRKIEDCGQPLPGHDWTGNVLQVWISDYNYTPPHQIRVQLGHRVDTANIWASTGDDRLRIDHTHIFLGAFDTAGSSVTFLPADAISTAAQRLADRQACDQHRQETGCNAEEWEHADPFTFMVLDIPEPAPQTNPLVILPLGP